jgi:hypothetical protein
MPWAAASAFRQGPSEAPAAWAITQGQSGSWHGRRLRSGRKPGPGPPGVGSRCTDVCVNTAGLHASAAMGLSGRLEFAIAGATAGFVRGHRAPVTTNNRRAHRDTDHRRTRMCKRPNLLPVSRSSQSQSSLLKSSNYELEVDRPGCDTAAAPAA